jgi:hypothetical protein
MPPRAVAIAVALIVAAVPVGARAQDTDDALTKRALQLRREGRDAEALDLFRRAYGAAPTPRNLAQIALAEQALGRWIDAERDLVQALASADDAWIGRTRATLERSLAAIREHLGSLDVTGGVPGAEVWVNGAQVGTLPLRAPLRVEAGSVVLEVRASGYTSVRRVTSVEPGGTAREPITLVPITAPTPTPEPPVKPPPSAVPPAQPAPVTPPAPDRTLRVASFVAFGAGALGIGAGAFFGVRTLAVKSDRDAVCGASSCGSPQGVALDGDARSLALRSTVWFIAGGAAALTGVLLYWRSLPTPNARSVRLAPFVGPNHAGATLGGSW